MNRRFMNMVYNSIAMTGAFPLHRLDVTQLFYRSTAAAIAARAKEDSKKLEMEMEMQGNKRRARVRIPELRKKPVPITTFHRVKEGRGIDMFALLGENKVVAVDPACCTTVYDHVSNLMHRLPDANAPKGTFKHVFSIPREIPEVSEFDMLASADGAQDSLYVLDIDLPSRCCFEVLSFSKGDGWCWRPLPTPPFLVNTVRDEWAEVPSALVGTKIVVSDNTREAGTYCYDTVLHEWSKAGDWALPVMRRAEHVPELGLWFGLLPDYPYHFCATDLSSVGARRRGKGGRPPTVQSVLADFDPPASWRAHNVALVNLGSGRFCTVKFFNVIDENEDFECWRLNLVGIFTGVEVARSDAGELQMIKHRTKSLLCGGICAVL